MSCYQQCRIWIAECPNTISPKTELLRLNSWTETRAFFSNAYSNSNKKVSDWIHLTKGEPYYMESSYVEYNGGDHMSTGVEFEQTTIVNHHQAMKEIQELKISTDNTREQTTIDIKNPDDKHFKLMFKSPKTSKFVVSGTIKCISTEAEFKAGVKDYYWKLLRSDIKIIRIDLDADGNNVTATNKTMVTIRYIIETGKLVASPSTTQIIVSKVGTSSTITAKPTSQISAPPISGKFNIICVSDVGQESKAININAQEHHYWIGHQIQQQCVGLYNRIEALPCDAEDGFQYRQNGMCVKIRFNGYNKNPGQFRVVQSTTTIVAGKDLVFSERTILPYGTNLFYSPIPFEMLRTYEEKPQFMVTVDNLPVVCHNMTCDYTYVKPRGEVTGATYNDETRKLVITGVDLPTLIASN